MSKRSPYWNGCFFCLVIIIIPKAESFYANIFLVITQLFKSKQTLRTNVKLFNEKLTAGKKTLSVIQKALGITRILFRISVDILVNWRTGHRKGPSLFRLTHNAYYPRTCIALILGELRVQHSVHRSFWGSKYWHKVRWWSTETICGASRGRQKYFP